MRTVRSTIMLIGLIVLLGSGLGGRTLLAQDFVIQDGVEVRFDGNCIVDSTTWEGKTYNTDAESFMGCVVNRNDYRITVYFTVDWTCQGGYPFNDKINPHTSSKFQIVPANETRAVFIDICPGNTHRKVVQTIGITDIKTNAPSSPNAPASAPQSAAPYYVPPPVAPPSPEEEERRERAAQAKEDAAEARRLRAEAARAKANEEAFVAAQQRLPETLQQLVEIIAGTFDYDHWCGDCGFYGYGKSYKVGLRRTDVTWKGCAITYHEARKDAFEKKWTGNDVTVSLVRLQAKADRGDPDKTAQIDYSGGWIDFGNNNQVRNKALELLQDAAVGCTPPSGGGDNDPFK